MTAAPALFSHLAALLGPAGYSTDAETIAPKLTEWRKRWSGRTPFLARPATTEEVAGVVRLCAQAGAPITPQGGNTGLVGGQIPDGEILLSLERMTQIRSVDAANDSMIVEAGVTLSAAHDAAGAAGRRFPLSLASQGSATVGGLISTNAGGVHVLRHGMMRDLTLGLEVVTGDGTTLDLLRALRKNNTGYDLKQMFIGAEGTLGIVTAAALKLFAAVASRQVALVALSCAQDALALLSRAKAALAGLSAFELMNRRSIALAVAHVSGLKEPFAIAAPYTVLIETESAGADDLDDQMALFLDQALTERLIVDAVIARSGAQEEAFWRLRESLSAGHRTGAAQANHDISCPVSMVPAFLAAAEALAQAMVPGARVVAFGHLGDGNIHLTVMAPDGADESAFPRDAISHAMHTLAVRMGGSISAEHGIGVARKDDFAAFTDPAALAMMRALKTAWDPAGIMNPRALLP